MSGWYAAGRPEGMRRGGVGLVLEARGRGPAFVAELAPGGSADRSGRVRVGDRLEKVDGQTVFGLTPAELSQIISGPDGTTVRLGFRRITSSFFAENEETFEVSLIRSLPSGAHSNRASIQEFYPEMREGRLSTMQTRDQNTHFQQRQEPKVFEYTPSPQFNRYSVPSQPYPYTSPSLHQANNGTSSLGGDLSTGESADRATSYRLAAAKSPEGRAVAEMYHPREEMRAEEGRDELVDELKALLSFVKSGFTSSNQLDSSQFLKSNTPAADAIREIYREVSALKSREASSENVLRVAKETLDARKKQIRTLTMVISNCFTDMADTRNQTIKKLQGKASLAGMGLSGSMDSGNLQASDTHLGDSSVLSDLGAELGEGETKRAEGAGRTEEGGAEKEEMKRVIVEQTSQIRSLEEKLHYLEEDHRQRSERITEVSERLMQKRKEEREMIESLKLELNEKNEIIQKLQAGDVASFAEYDQQGYSQYPETRI